MDFDQMLVMGDLETFILVCTCVELYFISLWNVISVLIREGMIVCIVSIRSIKIGFISATNERMINVECKIKKIFVKYLLLKLIWIFPVPLYEVYNSNITSSYTCHYFVRNNIRPIYVASPQHTPFQTSWNLYYFCSGLHVFFRRIPCCFSISLVWILSCLPNDIVTHAIRLLHSDCCENLRYHHWPQCSLNADKKCYYKYKSNVVKPIKL
jgi:hypothetical protein